MKNISHYIILFTLAILMPQVTVAQEKEEYEAQVFVPSGIEEEARKVRFALFATEKRAEGVRNDFQSALNALSGKEGNMDIEAWDKAVRNHPEFKWKESTPNGVIKFKQRPGVILLICTYNGDDMTIDDAIFNQKQLVSGENRFEIHLGSVKNDGQKRELHGKIGEVTVDGKYSMKDTTIIYPPIDDGNTIVQQINIQLRPGYARDDARMLIQPMAVECQMEDTIAYIPGFCIEGDDYHALQNKRMAFNYFKNDKVAPVYDDEPFFSGEPINITKTIVYKKPDKSKYYKIPVRISISDFSHTYYDVTQSLGSCNPKSIFKFLDYGTNVAEMDLDEFYIPAEENEITQNTDLSLKFQEGQAILTTDSTNQIRLNEMVQELKSYGQRLTEVTITASSSPDGGYDVNLALAKKRRDWAENTVKQYLKGSDVRFLRAQNPAHVCTWFDVADKLAEEGFEEIANQVRANTGANGYGGDNAIKAIPEFQDIIKPIMESLRKMNVKYTYEREHRMDETEVVEEYYKRKPLLLKGKGKQLSDGDYYNLFKVIDDPMEQDTLTMLAYKMVTSHAGYEKVKFSMYVANRMAALMQKAGTPDTLILKPFIDERIKRITSRVNNQDAQKNRREVMIGQITSFLLLEERQRALNLIHKYFEKDNDPKVIKLKQIVTFKEDFFKYIRHELDPAKEKEFDDAMAFVFSISPDNKPAIYTEARQELNINESVLRELLDQMDENNPKKWYLKGIYHASLEEKNKDIKKPSSYIPEYLCYFNKSFELNPKLKKVYFNDGQVSDELRKKFKWRKADRKQYEEMFVAYTNAEHDNDEIDVVGEEDLIPETNDEDIKDTNTVDSPAN